MSSNAHTDLNTPVPKSSEIDPAANRPDQQLVMERLTQIVSAQIISPNESAIERAVTSAFRPQHLTLMLKTADLQEANRHKETMERVRSGRTLILWALVLILFTVIFLAGLAFGFGHPEYALPIITTVVGLAGAYGIGRSQSGPSQFHPQQHIPPISEPPPTPHP